MEEVVGMVGMIANGIKNKCAIEGAAAATTT
jgi:hypothetical protein